MKDKYLSKIILQSYDLHVHMGPEAIPRRYNSVQQLTQSLSGKLAGVAVKNHFFSTVPMITGKSEGLKIIGSLVLNRFVGGLNPDVIYAASTLARPPFIVWFPTINAKQFLDNSEWEIAPEWVDTKVKFIARKSADVKGITILDGNGNISKSTMSVLQAIKDTGAILATGHISWQESRVLVKNAMQVGIKKIIVTHPIYQRVTMPVNIQVELAQMGAKIEQCWSMWNIDKISISAIASQIKSIGATNCIITSDSGQAFSPPPDDALYDFCRMLYNEGVSLNELKTMCVTNPKILISR